MRTLFYFLYFGIGLIQFAAIVSGFSDSFGFFGVILAFALGEIPIVGTVMGVRGAIANWGMEPAAAVALFIVPTLIVFIGSLATSRREHGTVKAPRGDRSLRQPVESLCRLCLEQTQQILSSRTFFRAEHDDNPEKLGAKKGPLSYFTDLIVAYLDLYSERLFDGHKPPFVSYQSHIARFLSEHRNAIPYNTSFSAASVVQDFVLMRPSRELSRFKAPQSDASIEEKTEYVGNILSFRVTGWERSDVEYGNLTQEQQAFVRSLVSQAENCLGSLSVSRR